MNNLTILQQLVSRWKAKSPSLFKAITTIATIAVFITGVPELLQSFGIALPEALLPFANKVIAIASLVALIISKLTVETPIATERVLEDINAGVKPEIAAEGK